MATQLFLLDTNTTWSTGNNDSNLRGTPTTWSAYLLGTSRGNGVVASAAMATVAGTTAGIEVAKSGESVPVAWFSYPLAADVTISGSITWNIWGRESANAANVAINGRLEVVDGATGTITLIDQTARVTEMAISATTNSVANFAETPAAGVACKKGDRLRVRIFGDDAGTMGAGQTFQIGFDGTTAAVNGDTYLTLTENLTFITAVPTGTTVYLTDSASSVSTASVDKEAWTDRGAGVTTIVTNTAAGWTSPIQMTDTAGGTVVDWFTRPLAAFTLGGLVRALLRGRSSNSAANAGFRIQIARVDGDGTNAVAWGQVGHESEANSGGEAQYALGATADICIAGDDLAVSDGQRIRIRVLIDDTTSSSGGAMAAGHTVTLYYAATGVGSGDTWLTFTQTLTEYVSAPTFVPPRRDFQQMLAH